jgi:hypothetical protein
MNRFLLLAVSMVSSGALAHDRGHGGVGIFVGGIDFGFSIHRHARPVPVPYVYAAPVYVQPPVYIQPQLYAQAPVYAPAPQYVDPGYSQPVYGPRPVPMAIAVQPLPLTPVVVSQREAPQVQGPAFLGFKYLGGTTVTLPGRNGPTEGTRSGFNTHTIGLELRPLMWLSVRSDLEIGPNASSWDMLGLKLSLPNTFFRPYVSASVSGSVVYAKNDTVAFGLTGAAGLDLFFGRRFFLEAEARYRALPSGCCDVPGSITASIGGGIVLF